MKDFNAESKRMGQHFFRHAKYTARPKTEKDIAGLMCDIHQDLIKKGLGKGK